MSVKRVLITAGGTGGHLYPAQSLAAQLKKEEFSPDILFVAGGLATNRCFDRSRFSFQEVASSSLFPLHPIKTMKGVCNLCKGFQQSRAILKTFRPDVVVGFGSYYTIPILLAARSLTLPIILHEANSFPGLANRWMAPLASVVGIHFPFTARFFKSKAIEVGLPLREGYERAAVDRKVALAYYGFTPSPGTLLIFGGSQGAHAINHAIAQALPLWKHRGIQILHLTGSIEATEKLASLYQAYGIQACVKAFEDQMQMAWGAANLFIGRAGASTVAEAIAFEVPGILIPYPHAHQHQEKNADFFVETVGGGVKLLEEALTPPRLLETLDHFYQGEQDKIYQNALKAYKKRSFQKSLAQIVLHWK